jgi:hypothetical protein
MGLPLWLGVAVVAGVVASAAAEQPPAAAVSEPAGEPHEAQRPVMRQLPPRAGADQPPASHDLVAARARVRRQFRAQLAQAKSSGAGATRAAEALLDAAVGETDRTLKWALLQEARRQAAAAGSAPLVDRAVTLAAALYDFDAIGETYQTLSGIPLRGIDESRAAALAAVAEQLAGRAEADGRAEMAAAAQSLALRGWQRAGDTAAARRAAARLSEIDPERVPGRR